jgi:hypothetical protein
MHQQFLGPKMSPLQHYYDYASRRTYMVLVLVVPTKVSRCC